MATIRETPSGRFELRITEGVPRPYYSTHDSRDEAAQHAARVQALIESGEAPRHASRVRGTRLSAVLRQYLNEAPVATSDRAVVSWLQENLSIGHQEATYRWVEGWVASMKEGGRLAPGTIRKRVESLARALDWWNRRTHPIDEMPANPLRMLPRGYSTYQDGARADVERDRRLAPEEHDRIVAVLQGHRRLDRERPWAGADAPAFLLLYLLIVNVGLRLREAYRLKIDDLRFDMRTIHVAMSKTGTKRDVPMTREVYGLLEPYRKKKGLLLPFWNGDDGELKRTTDRLSMRFRTLFEYAEVPDFTEHDLRHEATCRWMSMRDARGGWMFRSEEVQRITGHKNSRTFRRYLSLRGSDLADRLWE